jgi:hypothetical protein
VGRQRALFADPGVRYAALAAVPALGFLAAFGDRGLGLLASMPILALLVARLLAHQRPGRADYHALVPGLPLLLIGLVPITLSIVPWSDLEGRVRELFSVTALPMWLRGVTVVSGLVLLGGGFLVVQATPRLMLSRVAQLALLPAVLATAIHLEFLASLNHFFDARPIAARLALHQADGLPAAVLGPYSGEFHYLGRLPADLEQLPDATAAVAWAERNRDGIIVASFAGSMLHLPQQPLFLASLGPSWVALWPAQTVLESEGRVLAPRF